MASEGSVEQNRDLTNRNRIRGILGWTSGRLIAKSISIKGQGCRSGRCAVKALELTSGGLRRVPDFGTEGTVRRPDRGAEVSRGHIRRYPPARSIETLTRKGRNSQGSQGRSDMLKARTIGSGK